MKQSSHKKPVTKRADGPKDLKVRAGGKVRGGLGSIPGLNSLEVEPVNFKPKSSLAGLEVEPVNFTPKLGI